MTPDSQNRHRRVERLALAVALVAIVAALVLGWLHPDGIVAAWRFAMFACLSPAVGSLIFILIYRNTGGQWIEALAPYLLAGTRLLPWVWLLVLPLLWWPIAAQPYRMNGPHDDIRPLPTVRASDTIDAATALDHAFAGSSSLNVGGTVRAYFSRPFILARSIAYLIAFILLAFGAHRAMHLTSPAQMRWFGPAGLIGLVFLLHLLAVDWLMLLEPGWHSTGFELVWMTGEGIAGLSVATGAALWFGADPSQPGKSDRARGLDWGNLLLASVMSWMYVAFVQYLIIWSGDLPNETDWYRHRSYGLWHPFIDVLVVFEFGVPFLLLLSRRLKRSRRGLVAVAALLFVGQVGYLAVIILPSFPRAVSAAPGLPLVLFVATGALFLNRYLAGARRVAATLRP